MDARIPVVRLFQDRIARYGLKSLLTIPQSKSAVRNYEILALLSALLVMFVWALSSPVGSSPDDDYHLASAYCSHGTRSGLCEASNDRTTVSVPAQITRTYECYLSGSRTPDCLQSVESGLVSTTRFNSINMYPKFYYWANGLLANPDAEVGSLLMRILSIAVFVVIVTLAYLVSSALLRPVIPLALVIGVVPFGLFIFPSNNPSSWAVSGIFCFWVGLSSSFGGITRTDSLTSLSIALLGGVIAISARPDSALLLLLATVAVFFQVRTRFLKFQSSTKYILIIVLVSFLFLIDRISNRTEVATQGFIQQQSKFSHIDILFDNFQSYPKYFMAFFGFSLWGNTPLGHLGWFQVSVPILASAIVFFTATFFVFRNSKNWKNPERSSLFFLSISIFLIPLIVHQLDGTLIGDLLQPRYLYSLFLIILTLCISNPRRDTPIGKYLRLKLILGLTLAHGLTLHQFIRSYTTGFDSGFSLDLGDMWWGSNPVSPQLVWVIGTVAFGLLAASSVQLYFAKERPNEPDASVFRSV